MEVSLWLNGRSQKGNVAKGGMSALCCWEAAVHTHDLLWKKMDVKLMMMKKGLDNCPILNPSTYLCSLPIPTSDQTRPPPTFSPSLPTSSFYLCLSMTLTTSIFLQADTLSSTLLFSWCLNNLNLPYITTSATLWILKKMYNLISYWTFYSSMRLHTTISLPPL